MKLASILVVAAVAALPTGAAPGSISFARIDKFDNGKALSAVGDTAGGPLVYNAFVYTPLVTPQPPSGGQIITTGLRSQALEGQAYFGLVLDDHHTKCFDLRSVRNGCIANTQVGVASVPIGCTVQFSAHSATPNKEVKTKLLEYNPGLNFDEPFNLTTFSHSDFSCLRRVDVKLISSKLPAPGATVGTGFDDVYYNVHIAR